MNAEQMRVEFEDWWEQFKSEHEEWVWADREALLFQAWQAALNHQAKSEPVGYVLETPSMYGAMIINGLKHNTPLYAAPQPPQSIEADKMPEGFVLVPKEPTNLMVEAAERDAGGMLSVDDIVDAYRAMLAAAPSPDRRT